jgi:putative ABC transport system permease protein
LNLIKNKGRNILLGAIILTIITAAVMALAIYNTASASAEETKAALRCAVRVAPGIRPAESGGGSGGTGGGGTGGNEANAGGARQTAIISDRREAALTPEQYMSFAESAYLDGYDVKEGGRGADGVDAVYYLKRPEMLADFEAELRSNGLPDDYAVRTDESDLGRIAGAIERLKSLSLTFLIIVLSLGAIVIILLSAIAIRERKYEIGVLRAMGMKKKHVALGLWIEIIAITGICFTLGINAGAALSQPVSDAILAGRAQSAAAGSTTLADRLQPAEADKDQSLVISVSGVTILEIFGISMLLATAAGAASVGRITRSEPIKILMERD